MFIGRDREMSEIESLLARSDDVQLRAALDGLPGIGKTELARQVVARLSRGKKFPGGIFWFAAEHFDLRMQWAKIAEELGAPLLHELHERAAWAVRQVEHRAQRGDQILIVLDNVETWAPPPGPLPDAPTVRLLVTTRTRWLHNSFRPYEVRPLVLAHAKQLLDFIVGHDVADSYDLLLALGGHVLSVELAATYLREYGTPPGEYLRQLLAGKSPASSVAEQTSYRATAESAFRLLWQRLTSDLRAGWLVAAQLPPAWFSSELADAIGIDAERRRGLVRLHILDRDDQGRHQMHRLLREFALAEVPDVSSMRAAVIVGATNLLENGDPLLRFRRYSRDAACFEHLLSTISDDLSSLPLKTASGIALRQLGDLPRGRTLFEQALASSLRTYDDHHPTVATCRANLAVLLRQLGDLARARSLFEQALASDLKTYGADHPEVATTRANLAGLLQVSGDLSAARTLYEQALASHLKTYGDDHPGVAAIRANLARLLQDLGDLSAARALFEQALASNLKTYNGDHPEVATARANLAVLLQELGDLPAARALLEQALASNLKTYGANHPEVATTRANLARIFEKLGDLPVARVLHAEAFASDLRTYGVGHPKVARRRGTLVRLLRSLGNLPEMHIDYVTDSSQGTIYAESLDPSPALPADSVLIERALAVNVKVAQPSDQLSRQIQGPADRAKADSREPIAFAGAVAAPPRQRTGQTNSFSVVQATGRPVAILWVDDIPRSNSHLVDILRGRGIVVDCASSIRKALKWLKVNSYDVVVSGLIRPDVMTQGLDLLTRVRAANSAVTRLICFAGFETKREDHENAIAAGADEVIVSSAGLIAAIMTIQGQLQDRGGPG